MKPKKVLLLKSQETEEFTNNQKHGGGAKENVTCNHMIIFLSMIWKYCRWFSFGIFPLVWINIAQGTEKMVTIIEISTYPNKTKEDC